VPLTSFQASVASLLALNRTPDSYLAGGAALHIEPNGKRYSNDLDYFQDSEQRVASAFEQDRKTLAEGGFSLRIVLQQPGFVRAIVEKYGGSTKVEWAHDSAWRFLPVVSNPICGYQLHPLDLAINKVLALVGRDEPRDLLDTVHVHECLLPLGALCWAAAGKDPGFTPDLLLELLRRRGRLRPEDLARLKLAQPVDLAQLKRVWLTALDDADSFLRGRPMREVGCLYYAKSAGRFVAPSSEATDDIVCHFGRPGGVLPRFDFHESE
jgi:hypothetical protein